jgi:hypothetical protein
VRSAEHAALVKQAEALSKRVPQSSVLATAMVEQCELKPAGKWVDVPGLSVTYNAVDACLVKIEYHLMLTTLGSMQARVVVDNTEPAIKGRFMKSVESFDVATATAVAKLTAGQHVIKVQVGASGENRTVKLGANSGIESHLIVTPMTVL